MLNYLNQLEIQAKAHTDQLRQEAEVERRLRCRRLYNWAAPVLNVVPTFRLWFQPRVKSYR